MSKSHTIGLLSIALLAIGFISAAPPWGFFAHKEINRLAVFTLPAEMMPVYKKNIEHITSQAIAPDMRRFASSNEGIRHYIDADHWGETPFEDIPRQWSRAILKFADIYVVKGDDSLLISSVNHDSLPQKLLFNNPDAINIDSLDQIFKRNYGWQLYDKSWSFPIDSIRDFVDYDGPYESLRIKDRFSSFGIAPYNLMDIHNRLTRAFEEHDLQKILRFSADLGHYLADVHVPLHTSENYNGQMTNQVGIHAFWESRLPELFADEEYDYFVGQADYIKDMESFVWEVIEHTHSHLDAVLSIEKHLKETFPSDLQFCFEERNNKTKRMECREFSRAFHDAMDGMVEDQMRKAIKAVGDMWLSAWVLAGQPDMQKIADEYKMSAEELAELEELRKKVREGEIKGRDHVN